jgi:hypothetical protein
VALAIREPAVKYQPEWTSCLTDPRPGSGPCSSGSLTGAVSSQMVTEECNGALGPVGNRATRAQTYKGA